MANKRIENKTIIIFGIIIISIIMIGYYSINNYDLKEESELYKTILLADYDISKLSIDSQMAESYHDLASLAYEEGEDKEVERNCKIAREYYSKESQGYRRIKADLNSKNLDDKLIDIYINGLNEAIEITENLFEACEHFESAARYYDNKDYIMGREEIDMMNEKIRDHDEAVEKYNNFLEDFRIELKKRLE